MESSFFVIFSKLFYSKTSEKSSIATEFRQRAEKAKNGTKECESFSIFMIISKKMHFYHEKQGKTSSDFREKAKIRRKKFVLIKEISTRIFMNFLN
ncbi:MAG: hypothetical protein ACI4U2_04115 [Christensenellaceae bacterium]